jgi:hypothetical protein
MSRRMCCLFSFMIAIALIAASAATAQQQPVPFAPKKDVSFYRLDFVLRELDDGKIVNARSYSMWLKTDSVWAGNLRAGNDIPVATIPTQEKPAEVSYKNIGFQMDCALDEIDNNPVLTISGSISAVLPPDQAHDPKSTLPVFRKIAFKSVALLTPGKATMVSSIDDPGSKRRFQLEVTAIKLK